jgi:hypothetical protein
MYAIGGKPGRGLIAQGHGYPLPPDIAAVSPYTMAKQFEANATASINLLALEVAGLKRDVAELKREKAVAAPAPEPLWYQLALGFAMGAQAYFQAAERQRDAQRERRSQP